VERADRKVVATFFAADQTLAPGSTLSLGEGVARHVRALRLGPGTNVRLVDGAGHRAAATIVRLSREAVTFHIADVAEIPAPPAVHLLVPVADRERMLWLAEKCAELGATSWRPVIWRRSRSVQPRGEGQMFGGRVQARMAAALEQSSEARLPAIFSETTVERAIAATPHGSRLVLDRAGAPLLSFGLHVPVTIAVGPEGGPDDDELVSLENAGFVPASLGESILRFETAALVALAIVRATLALPNPPSHGN